MDESEIVVTIPADTRFVALARVTAASLAAELDFGVDLIEDLRVGADELIAHLVEWAEDQGSAQIVMRYRLNGDRVELHADARSGAEAADSVESPLDALTEQILAAVVDTFDISPGRGHIVKSRTRP